MICIAIAIHIHSVIPNATRTLSITVIVIIKCAQTLRNEGKISNDVCLMFNEMYLQKCEEYFAVDLVSCDSEGKLYKAFVCFVLCWLEKFFSIRD